MSSSTLADGSRRRWFADSPLERSGFELRVFGFRSSIFYTAPELGAAKGPGTTAGFGRPENGRFTVRRARLVPAMISTAGHRMAFGLVCPGRRPHLGCRSHRLVDRVERLGLSEHWSAAA